MKAIRITYSRLVSKPNYENAKIEIELEVEHGEKASDVFNAAKKWVEKRIECEKISEQKIISAYNVINDKYHHTLAQIEEAENIISRTTVVNDDELPF